MNDDSEIDQAAFQAASNKVREIEEANAKPSPETPATEYQTLEPYQIN
jgi:hypothetical protein